MVSVWVPVILMARIVLQTSSGDKWFSTWCLVLDSDHTTVITSSNRAMTAGTDPNRSHWHIMGFVNFPSWSPCFLFTLRTVQQTVSVCAHDVLCALKACVSGTLSGGQYARKSKQFDFRAYWQPKARAMRRLHMPLGYVDVESAWIWNYIHAESTSNPRTKNFMCTYPYN